MHACPRCWEVIEQPASLAEGALIYEEHQAEYAELPRVDHHLEQTAQVRAMTLTHEEPTYYAPPIEATPRRRVRVGRLILLGLLSVVLLTLGLLALEAWGPQLRGDLVEQVRLDRESFPSLDFAIRAPRGWEVREGTVGGRPAVVVREPATDEPAGELREFGVFVEKRSFDRARELADERIPASAEDYDEIGIIDGLTVDGRSAFRHLYTDEDEYIEDWWIERGGGTFRLEFSSPISRREESAQLNVRIARTFDVL